MGWRVPLWAVVLALAGVGAGQAPRWSWAGPAAIAGGNGAMASISGPVWALAVPTNAPPGTLLAGGVGGVWEYASGQWSGLSDGQPVSALAVSADGGTLYAGTGDANDGSLDRAGTGILMSANGGATWSTLGAEELGGLAITRIALDPANRQHLLAAGVLAPDSPATAQPGLYASSDGGATWTQVLAGGVWDLAWQGSNVLAAGETEIAVSTDDGATFAPVTAAGLPASWVRAAICPQAGGGFLLLFAGPNALVALSADGESAAALGLPPDFSASACALAVATDAQGDLWLGGDGVWESGEGGQSWASQSVGGANQHGILSAPGGSLWLAGDAGVWLGPGNGSWAAVPGLDNAALLALALTANGAVAALDDDGVASGSTGTAGTWSITDAGAQLTALAMEPGNPAVLYGLRRGLRRSDGALMESSDGGASWSPTASPPTIGTALAASSNGPWLGTSAGVCGVAGAVTAAAVASANPLQIWAAVGAQLCSSNDGGQTWTPGATLTAPIIALASDPVRAEVLAAATAAGVEVSLDGGTTWTGLSAGLPAAPVTALAVDGSETLWAATLGRGLWAIPLAASQMTVAWTEPPANAAVASSVVLQATVTAFGQPLAGAAVTFTSTVGGQTVWSGSASTGADGAVTIAYTLPQTAGTVTLTAAVAGPSGVVSAQATVTATATAVAALELLSGANQSQPSGQTLLQPIVLEAEDQYGNPVTGVALALADGSTGSFSPFAPTTGSNGQARVSYTLPATVGALTLTAGAAGVPSISWTETALPPPNYQLTLSGPTAPVAPNQMVTLTVQVTPIGGYSQPVTLACVAPPAGCSVQPTTVTPGQSATVSVNAGAFDANQTTALVQVDGDSTHTATATLLLEAMTLAASSTSITVEAGGAAAALPLTLTPVNGLSGPVAFSATLADGDPLPATLTTLFQPGTVTLAAGDAPVTVQFSVMAAASAGAVGGIEVGVLAGLVLLLAGLRRRRLWLAGALAMALAGCGGGSAAPDPPPVADASYPLQVTATVAGLQATVPVTVVVE